MVERSDNSNLIVGEEHLNSQYLLSSWKIWRTEVEKDIHNLLKRVDELENKNSDRNFLENPEVSGRKSFAEAQDDGFAGLCTCARLVRSDRASFLQCIWLVIFLVILMIVGINELRRVLDNMNAEFKPAKKYQTINYGDSQNNMTYDIPYIYLGFYVNGITTNLSYSANDTINDLLSSQDNFQDRVWIGYVDSSLTFQRQILPISEVDGFYTEESVTDWGFHGFFRLKPSNPDPSIGYFIYGINLTMRNLPIAGDFQGLFVSISRERATTIKEDQIYLRVGPAVVRDAEIQAVVEYDEKITRTYQEEYIYHLRPFLTSFNEDEKVKLEESKGAVEITFRGNLMIEYWREYVDYDYLDFFSAMGGYINLSSMGFFWGAYYLALKFGKKNTMGILPEFSFIFANFETVHMLEDKLN